MNSLIAARAIAGVGGGGLTSGMLPFYRTFRFSLMISGKYDRLGPGTNVSII
jgi:hypothetical protein